jgi:8-oxo-dGTP pyrophosphatase MutT (NUDIX family)
MPRTKIIYTIGPASKSAIKPRPASTVILVRQRDGELQVYLLKRSQKSRFFPETYVFPGGAVEPEDTEMSRWIPHVDMDLPEISQRLGGGMSEQEVVAHSVTAVRETFEEAGVLLCHRSDHDGKELEEILAQRVERGLPKEWLKELVVSEGWIVEFSRLARWAYWITPEAMPRRYETRFFLALMPQGQECMPDRTETMDGIWVNPSKGLEGNLRGEIPLSPPTLITLHQLMDYDDLDDLRAEGKTRLWGDALLPRMIPLNHGAIILEPWDPMFNEDVEVDEERLEDAILSPGEPFSRVWYHKGIWRTMRS